MRQDGKADRRGEAERIEAALRLLGIYASVTAVEVPPPSADSENMSGHAENRPQAEPALSATSPKAAAQPQLAYGHAPGDSE